MMRRISIFVLVLFLFSASFAQKRSVQYRSDGKNAFAFSILPGFDKFIRETRNASQGFGLGFEGSYTRTINRALDVRIFQRYTRLVDEQLFYIVGPDNLLIHSYITTGASADISLLNYDMFSIKVSVGPQVGYRFKINLKSDGEKQLYDEPIDPFGGFVLGMVFEVYPVKNLVLGLRMHYDQWFSNGYGYANIYPGPYVGVRF